MSRKSLFILILFVLIIVGLAGYVYLLVYNPKPTSIGKTPGTTPTPNLFPFESPTVATPTPVSIPGEGTTTPLEVLPPLVPRLQHISLTPIAGAMASTTASSTLIRYVDRGTGHIIDRPLETPTSFTISNTTIPKVYEAFWNRNGNALLMRYITELDNTISTYSATLSPIRPQREGENTGEGLGTTPYEVKGSYLTNNIKNVILSPKGDRLAMAEITTNGSVISISNLKEDSKKQIWSSPLSNWLVEWPSEKTLSVTTAPTGVDSGFSYFVNTVDGTVKKVLGPLAGLTTLTNKDASKVLFTQTVGKTFVTSLYDVTKGTMTRLSFRTLPEKCVWSSLDTSALYCAVPIEVPNATYPDDWYKGKVSLTDKIWYINTDTTEVRLLSDLYNESKDIIDVTNLTLDNKEQVLLFTNKNDLTLWSLSLTN